MTSLNLSLDAYELFHWLLSISKDKFKEALSTKSDYEYRYNSIVQYLTMQHKSV